MSESRIDAAIAEYLQAAEAGTAPPREDWLAKYPDLRGELEQFLADRSAFKHAAQPVDQLTMPMLESVPSTNLLRYFGDYELIDEIARGGMGVVYRARQVSLNRPVAVKMILAGQLASQADVQRFHAEAEAAANLDHPNILPIYEVGTHEGQHYFSMKLIEGGSLSGVRSQDSGVGINEKVEILVKVCRAVHFAHQRGIIHRDLKPANILLSFSGKPEAFFAKNASGLPLNECVPYVIDFGLARRVEGDSALTQTGAIVGTPSYMAPEQARAEKQLSTGVDVYALGAILYELLTGEPPFKGATQLDTILQVLEHDPADPRTLNPSADRDLSVIALRCLEKEPANRYTSAEALAEELERWLTNEPIQARKSSVQYRMVKWAGRHPIAVSLRFLAIAILLIFTGCGFGDTLWPTLLAIAVLTGIMIAHGKTFLIALIVFGVISLPAAVGACLVGDEVSTWLRNNGLDVGSFDILQLVLFFPLGVAILLGIAVRHRIAELAGVGPGLFGLAAACWLWQPGFDAGPELPSFKLFFLGPTVGLLLGVLCKLVSHLAGGNLLDIACGTFFGAIVGSVVSFMIAGAIAPTPDAITMLYISVPLLPFGPVVGAIVGARAGRMRAAATFK